MVHAALEAGLHAEPLFDPSGDGAVTVNLEKSQKRISPLFQAIAERQCTRGDYDGQPIAPAELRRLAQAGTGDGVTVRALKSTGLAAENVFDACGASPPAILS